MALIEDGDGRRPPVPPVPPEVPPIPTNGDGPEFDWEWNRPELPVAQWADWGRETLPLTHWGRALWSPMRWHQDPGILGGIWEEGGDPHGIMEQWRPSIALHELAHYGWGQLWRDVDPEMARFQEDIDRLIEELPQGLPRRILEENPAWEQYPILGELAAHGYVQLPEYMLKWFDWLALPPRGENR